jgi:hypothetical protein
VGFPVWWYTIATPVLAFLQKANDSVKIQEWSVSIYDA